MLLDWSTQSGNLTPCRANHTQEIKPGFIFYAICADIERGCFEPDPYSDSGGADKQIQWAELRCRRHLSPRQGSSRCCLSANKDPCLHLKLAMIF
jgi:hypothetical protein